MKKKRSSLVSSLLLLVGSLIGLTSCDFLDQILGDDTPNTPDIQNPDNEDNTKPNPDSQKPEEKHEPDKTIWKFDENNHYHNCKVKGCDEKFDQAPHTFGEPQVLEEATCTSKGLSVKTCTVCKYELKFETPILGHKANEKWDKDETNHWHTCLNCDEKLDLAAHEFTEWVVKTSPTCTAEGRKERECKVCGQKESEVIPKIEHNPSTEWMFDAKTHYHKCSGCDARLNEAEHTFTKWEITKTPTCQEEGSRKRTCRICNYEQIEVMPKVEHSYGNKYEHDETSHYLTCIWCGHHGYVEEHNFSKQIISYPSCDYTGTVKYECRYCDYSYTEDIPEKPHSPGKKWNNDENQHWHICKVCDQKIDVADHDWTEWHYQSTPTCYYSGFRKRECKVCGYKVEERVPKLEHVMSENLSFNEGYHWNECINCKAHLEKSLHTFGKYEIIKEASDTLPGERQRSCTVCGYTEKSVIPPLHTNLKVETTSPVEAYKGSITITNSLNNETSTTELPNYFLNINSTNYSICHIDNLEFCQAPFDITEDGNCKTTLTITKPLATTIAENLITKNPKIIDETYTKECLIDVINGLEFDLIKKSFANGSYLNRLPNEYCSVEYVMNDNLTNKSRRVTLPPLTYQMRTSGYFEFDKYGSNVQIDNDSCRQFASSVTINHTYYIKAMKADDDFKTVDYMWMELFAMSMGKFYELPLPRNPKFAEHKNLSIYSGGDFIEKWYYNDKISMPMTIECLDCGERYKIDLDEDAFAIDRTQYDKTKVAVFNEYKFDKFLEENEPTCYLNDNERETIKRLFAKHNNIMLYL